MSTHTKYTRRPYTIGIISKLVKNVSLSCVFVCVTRAAWRRLPTHAWIMHTIPNVEINWTEASRQVTQEKKKRFHDCCCCYRRRWCVKEKNVPSKKKLAGCFYSTRRDPTAATHESCVLIYQRTQQQHTHTRARVEYIKSLEKGMKDHRPRGFTSYL